MKLIDGGHPSIIAENVKTLSRAGHHPAKAIKHALEHATRTMRPTKKGQKPITFHPGGLHESTGVPAGQPIPAAKHAAAASGALGPKAKKQEQFFENVLK